MKTVKIHGVEHYFKPLAPEPHDNRCGITERYELFDMDKTHKYMGRLVKYTDGSYATFSGKNSIFKDLVATEAVVFVVHNASQCAPMNINDYFKQQKGITVDAAFSCGAKYTAIDMCNFAKRYLEDQLQAIEKATLTT